MPWTAREDRCELRQPATVISGVVKTDMLNEVSDEMQAHYLAGIPAGRFAEPEEIARVIRWLASEEAAYISGAVIPVDGDGSMGH